MMAFKLELYKSRRRGLVLIALAMAAVTGLWCAVGLGKMTDLDKATGYAFTLYQAPLLNAIVLPVMIAVLVSRMCDMEHKGSAMKSLFTMQSPVSLFNAKSACIAVYLLAAVLLQTASMLLLGELYGYTESLPLPHIALYAFSQWLVSMFLALLIQLLSLYYVNQFIPLVVGLIGGFLGLMAMFFPPVVMRLVPSAYYGLLSTVRMDWDPVTRATDFYYVGFSLFDCSLIIVFGAALFFIGRRRFAAREV